MRPCGAKGKLCPQQGGAGAAGQLPPHLAQTRHPCTCGTLLRQRQPGDPSRSPGLAGAPRNCQRNYLVRAQFGGPEVSSCDSGQPCPWAQAYPGAPPDSEPQGLPLSPPHRGPPAQPPGGPLTEGSTRPRRGAGTPRRPGHNPRVRAYRTRGRGPSLAAVLPRPAPPRSSVCPTYLEPPLGVYAHWPGGKLLQEGHALGHPVTGRVSVPSDDRTKGGRGHPGELGRLKYPKDLPGGTARPGSAPAHRPPVPSRPGPHAPAAQTWSIIWRASSTSGSCTSVSMV